MRRRGLFVALAIGVVAAAAWYFTRSNAFEIERNADRNILLVTIDTLRADALGTYGGRATTPALDRLAASGARFDFVHAHAVVTLPSHASILSGRYPYEHGIRDNTGYRFPAATPTLPTLLKAQGFVTAAFVGGFPLVRQFGLATGFDVYDDRLGTRGERAEAERPAPDVVRAAREWIGKQQGKWLTWIHVYDPHTPYAPPPEWASRFPADPYLGEVSAVDAALAGLLDDLASATRPTLVVVTADHGESLGEHGEATHSIFAYESTLRVPLIIGELGRGTAQASQKGVVIAQPARHVDLLPTILEAAGAPASPSSGTSLLALMRGDTSDRPSYFEAMTPTLTRGWAPLRGIVSGREKYIDLPIPELYDLAADPVESRNLADASQDRGRELFNLLKQFNVAPPGRGQAESADTLERLRSLGYVGGASAKGKEAYTEADDPKRLISLEQTMDRAAAAFARGSVDEAISQYSDVIRQRPDTEDAYRKLALVFWRTGRPREAVATLESALKAGVTQSEVIIKLGQYLAESGQPAKAIALLERQAGDDPDALIVLGNAFALAGRRADAARTFTSILQRHPDDAVALENLGAMQLQAGDYSNAEQSLRRAIELDPRRAGAHTALGVLLASTGRKAEAIKMWTRALELDPGDENARHNLQSIR